MNQEMISASLWYYDDEYTYETGKKILNVLEKQMFFQPTLFYAEKLTKNKLEKYTIESKEKYYKAFTDKNIQGIVFADPDPSSRTPYWSVDFTFPPSKEFLGFEPVIHPKNLIILQANLEMFKDEVFMDEFMDTVRALIGIVAPFYGIIDSSKNESRLLEEANEEYFKPDEYIQTIFGGNYFGKKYCDLYGHEKVLDVPVENKESINGGILFMLSSNLLKFADDTTDAKRRKVMQYLKIRKKRRFKLTSNLRLHYWTLALVVASLRA
ncbi:MAG: hypothetical protein Q4F05_01440 [bacterium]|nr:hypothetical protein [bacterium]